MFHNTQCRSPNPTGGFSPDTEIISDEGPVRVDELEEGDLVYALDPITQLAKLKSVNSVVAVDYDGPLIAISAKRSDFRLHPDHQIVYQNKAVTPVTRFHRAGGLLEKRYYRFIGRWRTPERPRCETVDITDLLEHGTYRVCLTNEDHGHTFRAALPDGCEPTTIISHIGYYFDSETFKRYQEELEALAANVTISGGRKHHRRPYQFDGDDFIEFIGWFVTEGSVTWQKHKDTAAIGIAQKTDEHRAKIEALFERMNIPVTATENGFEFGSALYGRLVEGLSGSGSYNKHLPAFVWDLPVEQLERLFTVLLWGDGNDHRTYYTHSDLLAKDVCRLQVELGIKPRYTRRNGGWQVYSSRGDDRLDSMKHVMVLESPAECIVYQLGVEDYSTVLAGRNGKFQWISVSKVL